MLLEVSGTCHSVVALGLGIYLELSKRMGVGGAYEIHSLWKNKSKVFLLIHLLDFFS